VELDAEIEQTRWSRLRSLVCILDWLPAYQASSIRPDIVAGLTLAAYAIPISVAYTSLAGLPPQAGLYCYLVGGIAYAIFGTSRQLAVGPTSAISILIGSALGSLASGDAVHQLQLAGAVSVIAGIVGILAWLLHLGNIANFVSETILSGFKIGAGLVIASTQLPKLLGLHSGGNNFFTRIYHFFQQLGATNVATLCVGVAALALLILGERLLPRRPIGLFVVAISIAVMSFSPLASHGVKTIGTIPQGFPVLHWPVVRWNEVDELLPVALACFLLSYVESISVVRTFSIKHGYKIRADQELLALGAANIAAGVAQGYPVAGGMSQSAVNENAGARTPVALLVASAGIAAVLAFLTPLIANLPDTVLAAIVLVAVRGLIRPYELRHLYRVSKSEFGVALLATVAVLSFGVLKGVLLAAIFSVLLLLKLASHPRIALLWRLPASDRFVDAFRYPESEPIPNGVVLRVEAGLFYFNADNVKQEVLKRVGHHGDIGLLILDLSTTPNVDTSGARMLRELDEHLTNNNVFFGVAEAHGNVRDLLRAEGLDRRIPGVVERTTINALIERRFRTFRCA
jgi:SulP family sulfate permease